MKKVIIIGSLTAIVIVANFLSCKRDSFTDIPDNSYDCFNDSLFAPLSIAKTVAENVNKSTTILKTTDKTTLKSSKYQGKRKIKSNLTITDKREHNPYFYVLNYESGGYAIISADKRMSPIVGYSDNGYFNADSLPLGLQNWLEANASLIKSLRGSKAQQSESTMYQWANLECENPLAKGDPTMASSLKELQCPPPTPPESYDVTVTVGPLLKTAWSQGCGYNTFCPALVSTTVMGKTIPAGPCEHAYTGCSTTAVAQIMAYWKYPATYNWDAMSLYSGNSEVAKLMGDIFPKVIDSYSYEGSGCSNDYNIKHAFTKFNYSSVSLAGWVNGWVENGGYSYQKVVSNLSKKEPVILGAYKDYRNILGLYSYPTGSGHTWVCDGYMQSTVYQNGIESAQYLYFHMNWGWGQYSYNGWYAFDSWTNPNGSYNYFKDIIFDIHP